MHHCELGGGRALRSFPPLITPRTRAAAPLPPQNPPQNICSEFLCIADRPFYGDWWTSTSFEHFSRQWNKPISDFLRRHLYAPLKRQGSRTALLVTMAFSIAMHEVFLCAAMGGTWRLPWLAIFSVFQLPLIPLLRLLPPTAASNLFFWAGLSAGLGCIALLYARDYSSGSRA